TTYAQRNQPTSLKERIAALNAGASTQSGGASAPGNLGNPQGSLRAKVAQFEQKGPVPAPKTSFGSAAPIPGGPLEPQLTGKSAAPGLGPPPRGAKGARSVSAPFASEPEAPKPASTSPPPPAPSPPETPPKLAKDLRQRSTSFAAALDRARHAEAKAKQREARERARVTPNHTGTSQGVAPQHTGSSGAVLTPMHTGGSAISWLVPMNTGNSSGAMLSPHVTGGSSFPPTEGVISEDPEEVNQLPAKPPLTTGDAHASQSEPYASSPRTNGAPPSLSGAESPIPTSTSPSAADASSPRIPNRALSSNTPPAPTTAREDKRQSQNQYIQV
ncbi:hypothetical protein HDZ31DRAFT_18113, partial [Schizophyllum fasciatum]